MGSGHLGIQLSIYISLYLYVCVYVCVYKYAVDVNRLEERHWIHNDMNFDISFNSSIRTKMLCNNRRYCLICVICWHSQIFHCLLENYTLTFLSLSISCTLRSGFGIYLAHGEGTVPSNCVWDLLSDNAVCARVTLSKRKNGPSALAGCFRCPVFHMTLKSKGIY